MARGRSRDCEIGPLLAHPGGRHLPGGLILSALLAACRFVHLLSRPFGRRNLPATDLPLTFRIRCTAGVGPAQALLSFQSMATSGLAMNMDE